MFEMVEARIPVLNSEELPAWSPGNHLFLALAISGEGNVAPKIILEEPCYSASDVQSSFPFTDYMKLNEAPALDWESIVVPVHLSGNRKKIDI